MVSQRKKRLYYTVLGYITYFLLLITVFLGSVK